MKLDRTPAPGAGRPDLVEQPAEALTVAEPAHPPEHAPAGMLEGQVEVGSHARGGCHHLHQAGPDLGRLQVTHPDPFDAGHGGQFRQQCLQQPQVAQVLAVRSRILADQQQLAHALAGQPPGLGHEVARWPGDERAAEGGDGAEAAAAVAPGGDLERGDHAPIEPAPHDPRPGRGSDTRRQVRYRRIRPGGNRPVAGQVRARGRPAGWRDRQQPAAVPRGVRRPPLPGHHGIQPGGDLVVVVKAQDLGLRQRLGQPGTVALGQAPGGDHLGTGRRRAKQLVNRLFLGRLDEAAGVDQDYVGLRPVASAVGQRPASGIKPRGEFLRVDLIAGAAQRDQADGTPFPACAPLTRRHTGRLR